MNTTRRPRWIMILLLLFIGIPLLDMATIVMLGRVIGLWGTLAFVIGCGVVGTALARSQGAHVWGAIQRDLAEGRPPSYGLLDGLMVLIAGVLLITPGFLTDIAGLLLLLPPVREVVKHQIRVRLERALAEGTLHIQPGGGFGF
jgi:UPF0716 protein FxsA